MKSLEIRIMDWDECNEKNWPNPVNISLLNNQIKQKEMKWLLMEFNLELIFIMIFAQFHEDYSSLTFPKNLLKIRLIDQNLTTFRRIISFEFAVSALRIAFILFNIVQKELLTKPGQIQLENILNLAFYMSAALIEILTICSNMQIRQFLNKQQAILNKIKIDLQNNLVLLPQTQIGSFTRYLSIYDILKYIKNADLPSKSYAQIIRYINFFVIGELANNDDFRKQVSFLNGLVIWVYILSIYLSAFQLDLLAIQGSDGSYIEPKRQQNYQQTLLQETQMDNYKELKRSYVQYIRAPFKVLSRVAVLLLLSIVIIYYENSVLCLFLTLCIATQTAELMYEKHTQSQLLSLNLEEFDFDVITPFKILKAITQKTYKLHLAICSANRFAIILFLMSVLSCGHIPRVEFWLLIFASILLVASQFIKFYLLATGNLYVLRPTTFQKGENMECSICLMSFQRGETILELPCFSNHIFHRSCMLEWLKQRKQCPLCRYSIQKYKLK